MEESKEACIIWIDVWYVHQQEVCSQDHEEVEKHWIQKSVKSHPTQSKIETVIT